MCSFLCTNTHIEKFESFAEVTFKKARLKVA